MCWRQLPDHSVLNAHIETFVERSVPAERMAFHSSSGHHRVRNNTDRKHSAYLASVEQP